MNREDAIELAKRIKRSHYSIVNLDDWTDYLVGWTDLQLATQAVEALREVDPIIPKDFGNKYRELARRQSTDNVIEMPERPAPRLTRAERLAILAANGAPERYTKERTP